MPGREFSSRGAFENVDRLYSSNQVCIDRDRDDASYLLVLVFLKHMT